jgi:hypothetical protein
LKAIPSQPFPGNEPPRPDAYPHLAVQYLIARAQTLSDKRHNSTLYEEDQARMGVSTQEEGTIAGAALDAQKNELFLKRERDLNWYQEENAKEEMARKERMRSKLDSIDREQVQKAEPIKSSIVSVTFVLAPWIMTNCQQPSHIVAVAEGQARAQAANGENGQSVVNSSGSEDSYIPVGDTSNSDRSGESKKISVQRRRIVPNVPAIQRMLKADLCVRIVPSRLPPSDLKSKRSNRPSSTLPSMSPIRYWERTMFSSDATVAEINIWAKNWIHQNAHMLPRPLLMSTILHKHFSDSSPRYKHITADLDHGRTKVMEVALQQNYAVWEKDERKKEEEAARNPRTLLPSDFPSHNQVFASQGLIATKRSSCPSRDHA